MSLRCSFLRLGPLLAALLAVTAVARADPPKAAPKKVSVELLDAGAAGDVPKLVKTLSDAGFEVAHQGKAEVTRSVSEIYFAKGYDDAAKRIAAVLGAPAQAVLPLSWKSPYNVVVAAAASGEVEQPHFSQYPATAKCAGPPAAVDFSTDPDSRRFVTRITEGAAAGPNFAGCFTVVEWGCGSGCQSFVIVDARNGRIFSPDFATSEGAWYRRDSALLVADPVDVSVYKSSMPPPSYVTTKYLKWDGTSFVVLSKSRALVDRAKLEK